MEASPEVRSKSIFDAGGMAGKSPKNAIDKAVLAALNKEGIEPANLCSDAVFVRRVYLDIIGTLPQPAEVRAFMQDRSQNKRAALIDNLMERDEFADYWSLKWCDLLRVKAEFPINLWPNGVQAYHRWIHEAIRTNMPYDEFARALLTSSGSNFRVPPVNFYRAVQGEEPSAIAGAVSLTFMGVRLENWPDEKRSGMEAFFSRIQFKPTSEWKEEIVCLDPSATEPLKVAFPNGVAVTIDPTEDPRRVFADWLITPENPWFTKNIANRVWAWLMGRGIIDEPDDIRPDNPASNPDLLALLEEELVKSDCDLRHLFRLILHSRTYQQSPVPQSEHPDVEKMFACYPVRQLEAEVLVDALNQIFGGQETYSSQIPEPYTFIPGTQRSIKLADGSITSPFLEMFGRPARDTGLESERNNQPTEAQRLHFLNSSNVQLKIERSQRVNSLTRSAKGNRDMIINALYMNIMSRNPTPAELSAAQEYFKSSGNLRQGAADLAWALINTKEFLYRH